MQRDGARIKGIAARAGHWSATHRKKAIGIWVAFVVVAQAIAGALVFFFWRGTPPAGASKPRSPEVRLTR